MKNVFTKLGVRSRAAAVVRAVQLGLIHLAGLSVGVRAPGDRDHGRASRPVAAHRHA